MSEAPKEIWIEDEFGEGHEDQWSYGSWDCRNIGGYVTSYTLTTHALAMVAAAWNDGCIKGVFWRDANPDGRPDIDAAITSFDPSAATTALDALLKAEREAGRVEGLREAVQIADKCDSLRAKMAIKAAMEKDDE